MPTNRPSSTANLRARAQERLKSQALSEQAPRSAVETLRLLHELQVHQIELEMQNEELQFSRSEVESVLLRYTNLYDFAPTGYFTVDKSGLMMQANLAGASLLELDRADVFGKRFSSFLLEADVPRFNAWLVKAFSATQPPQRMEVTLIKRNLPQQVVQIEGVLSPDGQACGLSVIDISDRKLLEIARLRATALEVDRQAAEAASKAKSAFMSRMSHELRTPLNAIMGFTQLLKIDQNHVLDDVQEQRLEAIMLASTHLLQLIEEVLDLSCIESGSLRMDIELIPVQSVLDDALQLVEPTLNKSGLTMSVEHLPASASHDDMVRADKTRLVQVFVNLLSNAIKYNSVAGKVHVIVDATQAGITRVAVADTGCGMTELQLAGLFEPFNRMGQEQSGIPGTGIGLVITKWLVELMDGRLLVQSTPGKGSRFDVLLPSVKAQDRVTTP